MIKDIIEKQIEDSEYDMPIMKINKEENMKEEVLMGGGHHVCDRCGITVFGSVQHFCEKDKNKLLKTKNFKDHRMLVTPYELDFVELINYSKFLKSLPKEYKNKKIYFRWEAGSGIGISVHVKCEEIETDITNYDTW